ncbi:MAG: hypothetical protein V7603_435 [Micromonosporaceae bacterium]|jgi:NitT/TauT family transport system substrate-binding protein
MSAQPADPAPADKHSTQRGAPGDNATDSKPFAGRLTRRGALALAPAVALAAGCTSTKKTAAATTSLDSVTYMTAFGTFGREGYVYVANAKGFFREAGIQVKVLPGTGQPANLQALVSDQLQFISQESAQAMNLIATGMKDARMIGSVHQRTVIALMALASSGIARPADLQNKTIAYGGQAPHLLYPAYAKLAGFPPQSTKWTFTTPQQLPVLLASARVDAIGQFVTGAPLIKAATKGKDLTVLPYSDYLGDLYGNVVLTNAKTISTKPDLVRRFMGALMKGLSYSITNPEESGRLINQAVSTTPAAVATAELQVMKPYVTTNGSVIGALDLGRISQAIALMTSIGVIPQGVLTPDNLVDFTFVPKA